MEIIINDAYLEEMLERTGEITEVDYSEHSLDSLCCALQDMLIEYKKLQDDFDDYKAEVEDTMRPLTMEEYTGAAAYRGV